MMEYEVVFVGDDELPEGKEWAIVRAGRRFIAFIKRSCVCPRVLRESWEAFAKFHGFDDGLPPPRWNQVPAVWAVCY